jgi:hypothetical protein
MGSVRPRAGRAQCARWLRADAPDHAAAPLPSAVARRVASWERFSNGPSLKVRLMSRYLYGLGHPGAGTIHIFTSPEAGLLDYGRLQNR